MRDVLDLLDMATQEIEAGENNQALISIQGTIRILEIVQRDPVSRKKFVLG